MRRIGNHTSETPKRQVHGGLVLLLGRSGGSVRKAVECKICICYFSAKSDEEIREVTRELMESEPKLQPMLE